MQQSVEKVILAVDDDPVILNALVSVLKMGYSVRPLVSGKAVLEFLERQRADLILLDYQMPGMTGFDVLGVLQDDARTRDIPVIILTGASDSESEVKALELGAVDYITKPVRPRVLLTRVRVQLELQRYRKELQALVDERTRKLHATYEKLRAREEATLNMLARATDLRDHDTGGHLERTTEFVRVIVEDILAEPRPGYELDRAGAEDIVRSAKLHDLGKIAMPDSVLLKPARLTPEEYEIIKRHPLHGEHFLNDFVNKTDDSFLLTAKDIAYSHHERWDGMGYPLGLAGNEIPLSARIVAIADVYDALTSRRPYKKALSHEQAVQVIQEGGGTQFDPYLTQVFTRHAQAFNKITMFGASMDGLDAV